LGTISPRARLWVIVIIAAACLAGSSLTHFAPLSMPNIALRPLGRPILTLGLVLVLLICLSGLALGDTTSPQVISDGLTGLFNQNYVRQRLQEEYYRAKRYDHPLSLLMIEPDDFKLIKNRFGRAVGDQLLRRVGQIIRDTIRPCDIAARFGGQEFLVILPDTGRDDARAVAERLQQRTAESPFRFGPRGQDIRLTVSIGASAFAFPDYGRDAGELVTLADLALFEAKKAGRSAVSFTSAN
jgi:diguanylate cyclase (GGDEF)-like protein